MKPYDNDSTKKEQVREMFDNIAPTYDTLNHTLSAGIDRWWRRVTVRTVLRGNPRRVLDIATGTGDLAIALARAAEGCTVTGADLSEGMLALAREKSQRAGTAGRTRFVRGDAERMEFADGEFDAVTVAFGVRNFGDLPTGLREMQRVLRSGGTVAVLELSIPRNPLIRWLYGLYSHSVMPLLGGAVSHDRAAYRYLPGSVEEFPSPERFADIMAAAGFADCKFRRLTFGTACLYTAVKP